MISRKPHWGAWPGLTGPFRFRHSLSKAADVLGLDSGSSEPWRQDASATSVALHFDPVLPQRVADLPRREPEDARDLRLSPARLFHGFDERVFAKLRKMTIDFTR